MPKSKFSDFGRKPWTIIIIIVHGFIFAGPIKASRKVYHLNGNEKRKQMALVSIA